MITASAGNSLGPRRRALLMAVLVTALSTLILRSLYWYQVTDHRNLVALASEEHEQTRPLTAKRGAILDTNGRPVALSVMYDAVYVYAPRIPKPEQAADLLADALGLPRDRVLTRIREASDRRLLLASRVPSNAAARIQAAGIEGIQLDRIAAREYPEGSFAAQLLGFVGAEGRGMTGLELIHDDELAGKPGWVITERDTDGDEITIGRKALVAPIDGSDLILSIDRHMQRVAEKELKTAVEANKAVGGSIIIMEAATGAVIAMATTPTYSLTSNALDPANQQLWKAAPVTDTYEPGSVMKLVTAAAAIEEGVVTPDTVYNDIGRVTIGGQTIENWDKKGYGNVSVRQILIYSLNTGSQWIARRVGAERFYDYLTKFGFGTPTGVQLNGEASGLIRKPSSPGWTEIDLATNSYGQGMSVTPLQIIAAVAALGNQGVLMRPQFIREIRRPDGAQIVAPEPVRAVVSPSTAATMLDIMVSVWDQPALQAQRIPGHSIAGKSGTADIPGTAGYGTSQTIASFVGLLPMPNPRFAMLVRIDRPEALYGGAVAAPVFRAMAKELFNYYRIPTTDVRAGAIADVGSPMTPQTRGN